jgi:hypothetical protein
MTLDREQHVQLAVDAAKSSPDPGHLAVVSTSSLKSVWRFRFLYKAAWWHRRVRDEVRAFIERLPAALSAGTDEKPISMDGAH